MTSSSLIFALCREPWGRVFGYLRQIPFGYWLPANANGKLPRTLVTAEGSATAGIGVEDENFRFVSGSDKLCVNFALANVFFDLVEDGFVSLEVPGHYVDCALASELREIAVFGKNLLSCRANAKQRDNEGRCREFRHGAFPSKKKTRTSAVPTVACDERKQSWRLRQVQRHVSQRLHQP